MYIHIETHIHMLMHMHIHVLYVRLSTIADTIHADSAVGVQDYE